MPWSCRTRRGPCQQAGLKDAAGGRASMKSNTSFGSVQQSACDTHQVSPSCSAARVSASRGNRTHVLDPDAEVADVVLVVLHLQQRARALLQQLQQVAVPSALRESRPRPADEPGAVVGASGGACSLGGVCSSAAAPQPHRERVVPSVLVQLPAKRAARASEGGRLGAPGQGAHRRCCSTDALRAPPLCSPSASSRRPRFSGCMFSLLSSQAAAPGDAITRGWGVRLNGSG